MKTYCLRPLICLLLIASQYGWAKELDPTIEDLLQQEPDTVTLYPDVDLRLQVFCAQLIKLQEQLTADPKGDKLAAIESQMQNVDICFNTYTQAEQMTIAEDNVLMQDVVDYQNAKQALSDTLASRHKYVDGKAAILAAIAFMSDKDTTYQALDRKAFDLSLVKQLETQLQQLKTHEQVLFAQVQAQFDAAQQAAQACPELNSQLSKAEEQYAILKTYSDRIQAAEYKPFITRIKDYLMGLAAVAILIMFVGMVQSKIKAIKQAKEAAKQYQEMLKKQNDEIPSI